MSLIKTKNTVIILLLLFICSMLNAQSPQKMSFQAVIRNASNTVISLRPVGIKISLLQGSALGKSVYAETQTVTTNFNGLISIQIGTGNVVNGSFSAIDWANGPYFIKTETDPNGGNDYTIIGTSELLSVPYALFALNSNTTPGLIGATGLTGTTGLTGETGAKGIDGVNGVDGTDGINGIDAINGEQKIISGHTVDYYRGDKTWQVLNSNIVAEGANKYFTEARARLSVSAGVGLHYDSTTGIMRSTISDAKYIQLDALSSIATGLDYHKNTGIFQLSPTYFIPNSNNLSGMNTGDQVLPTLVSLNGESKIDIGIDSEYYRGDKTWQILNANAVGIHNATVSIAGLIQLNGDLTGQASLPRIAIGAIKSTNILNLNVTDEKIESVSGNKVIGNISGSAENITGIVEIMNGGTGVNNIAAMKLEYGLEHVDNINDLNKPISNATKFALESKSSINSPVFTGTVYGITKDMIGLSNVNNTSDLNKPVSYNTSNALLLKENSENKSTSSLLGNSNILFPTQNAVQTYVDLAIENVSVYNATTINAGKIKLGGDLNGTGSTAEAPIISDFAITSNKIKDRAITDQKIETISAIKILGNITGNATNITGILSVANGGTGQNSVSGAKIALGLDNINNTSDLNKEISAATNTALSAKANTASPNFTGIVSAPDFNGALNGNATTSNRLATSRTINGINFDGSQNIVITDDTRILQSEKAANNGLATLDGSGKILISQLPAGSQSFKGTWNAATNTPTLADGIGSAGWTYVITIAGSQDFGNQSETYFTGDNIIYNGSIWQRSPNVSNVVSVNDQKGVITLTTADITEGSNAYFTNSRSRNAISSTLPILYNSSTGIISAQLASISQNGFLSASDWNQFNTKQNSGNYITPSSSETLTNKVLNSPVINSPIGINKNDIGLSNVNNIADEFKNVLSAQKITTPRTINGILFDGSSNINIVDPSRIANSEKAAINGVATLDAFGKIPSSQMSSIAISNTYVIADEADMLALTLAQKGDIAIRTDLHSSLILTALPSTNASNWQELLTPLATVQNINGKIGIVTLNTDDISEGANLYFTNERVAGKEPVIISGSSSQYYRGDKTWQILNSNTIGLDNVDNTADVNKSTLSASKLTTPRYINGVSFDGTHDITINATTNDATNLIKGRILLGGDLNGIGSSALTPIISLAAISNEKIADNAISTTKILDASITLKK